MMSYDYGNQLKNIGMQLQTIGLNIQNMGMQYPGIIQNQIQNIGIQVSSFGTQIFSCGVQIANLINNMKGMNMNFNYQIPNLFNQMQMMGQMNPFISNKNINDNIQENNSCNDPNCDCKNPNIIRIVLNYFGEKKMYIVNRDSLIEEIFNNFIREKNLDKKRIEFWYNATKLNYNNSTKIKDTPLVNCSIITVYEYNRMGL